MPRPNPAPTAEDNEEARAFLQRRLALFWKVLFFFNLAGGLLGLAGSWGTPGRRLPATYGR